MPAHPNRWTTRDAVPSVRRGRGSRATDVVAATLAGLAVFAALPSVAGAAPVPYGDPSASGVLTLCDRALRPITSGSVGTAPFVWRAAGATAAPPLYAVTGRVATLYAYQPRPQIPADEWSGQLLTAATRYSQSAHPLAQATGGDVALSNFLGGFPPLVDGLIQLRLYLGAPQQPPYQARYDAVDIRVTGTRWAVVERGTASCTAGTAVSRESQLLPSSLTAPSPSVTGSTTTPPTAAIAGAGARSSSAPAQAGATGTSGSAGSSVHSSGVASVRHGTDSGSRALSWGLLGLALLLAAGLLVVRRRRNVPSPRS